MNLFKPPPQRHCNGVLERARELVSKLFQGFEERGVGDFNNPGLAGGSFPGQERSRRRPSKRRRIDGEDRGIARGEQAEAGEQHAEPEEQHDEERDGELVLRFFDQQPAGGASSAAICRAWASNWRWASFLGSQLTQAWSRGFEPIRALIGGQIRHPGALARPILLNTAAASRVP